MKRSILTAAILATMAALIVLGRPAPAVATEIKVDVPTACPEAPTVTVTAPTAKGFRIGVYPLQSTFLVASCNEAAKVVTCNYSVSGASMPIYAVNFPKGVVKCKTEGRKILWTF